jgi:hypothetical protein
MQPRQSWRFPGRYERCVVTDVTILPMRVAKRKPMVLPFMGDSF